jgi:beta-galactosidase
MTIKLGACATSLALALVATSGMATAAERLTLPLSRRLALHPETTPCPARRLPASTTRPGPCQRARTPGTEPATTCPTGPHLNTPATLNTIQGVGWYRLTFTAPADFKDKAAWLQFDAASRKASVWLNGVHLGDHAGGFSRFRLDASKAIKPGQANLLVVKVDSSRPVAGGPTADTLPLGGDFFVHGGLYRAVSLVATDKIHFDMLDLGGPGVYATDDRDRRQRRDRVQCVPDCAMTPPRARRSC